MTKRRISKLVHEGDYVAEVEVELIYTDEGWSPYLSLSDAQKLDEVREALRRGELEVAARLAARVRCASGAAQEHAGQASALPALVLVDRHL